MTLAGGQYIFITNPRTEILYTIKEREKKSRDQASRKVIQREGDIIIYRSSEKQEQFKAR